MIGRRYFLPILVVLAMAALLGNGRQGGKSRGNTSGGSGFANMFTTAPDTYRSGDFDIDSPGDWRFVIKARDGAGSQLTATSTARIARPENGRTCGTPTRFEFTR